MQAGEVSQRSLFASVPSLERRFEELLGSIRDFERTRNAYSFSLEPFLTFLEKKGGLDLTFQSCQVLGTNGKGTAAFFLAFLLSFQKKVGLYRSPHIISFRERFAVLDQGQVELIDYPDLFSLLQKVNALSKKSCLSPFEKLTALAFLYFKKEKVEWVVCEAGLGGRYDATSVLPHEFYLLTPIALDHTKVLGNTLKSILHEKIGAIRSGRPLYVFPQKKSVQQLLQKPGAQLKILFISCPQPLALGKVSGSHKLLLPVESGSFWFPSFSPILAKSYLLSHRVLESYFQKPFFLPEHPPKELLFGRRTVVREEPPLIFDGAHNPESIRLLVSELEAAYPDLKWQVVFSCLKDKNFSQMCKALQPIASCFFFPETSFPFVPVEKLKRCIFCNPSFLFPSRFFVKEKPVLVTGSFRLFSKVAAHL